MMDFVPMPGDGTEAGGRQLPIFILTGFLGSGKTTFLNRLLSEQGTARTLVIINDFGEIGIDGDLVVTVDGTLVMELENGCVCCSIGGDLARTLRETALSETLRGKAGARSFDRVVIETSGLSDPVPIVRTLQLDADLRTHYRLAGIIAMLDVTTAAGVLEAHVEANRQVALADHIVLSKVDLGGSACADVAGAMARQINPLARLTRAEDLAPAAEVLVHATSPARALPDDRAMETAELTHHGGRIGACAFTRETPLPLAGLNAWLETALLFGGHGILRVKGLVDIEGFERPVLLQGIQHAFHPPEFLQRWPRGKRQTRLVFIGETTALKTLGMTLSMFAGMREDRQVPPSLEDVVPNLRVSQTVPAIDAVGS